MSNLPPAVQAQVDRANELQKQLENPKQDLAPNPVEETDTIINQETQPAPIEKQPESIPAEPEKNGDVNFWRNKFNVVNGKLKAEVPRLSKELKITKQENIELKQKIEALNNNSTQGSHSGEQSVDALLNGLTQAERDEYGEELLAVMAKVAKNNTPKADTQVVDELKTYVDQQKDDDHSNQQASHLAAIDKAMPDWRAINAQETWLTWLEGVDPFSGIQRQKLLDNANQAFNAGQVIQIFQSFKNAFPSSVVPKDQVQPNSVNSTTPPGDETVITRAFISEFYAAKVRGDYRGKEDEARAVEVQINQAVSRGKVKG